VGGRCPSVLSGAGLPNIGEGSEASATQNLVGSIHYTVETPQHLHTRVARHDQMLETVSRVLSSNGLLNGWAATGERGRSSLGAAGSTLH
jgi:hypothetical protein